MKTIRFLLLAVMLAPWASAANAHHDPAKDEMCWKMLKPFLDARFAVTYEPDLQHNRESRVRVFNSLAEKYNALLAEYLEAGCEGWDGHDINTRCRKRIYDIKIMERIESQLDQKHKGYLLDLQNKYKEVCGERKFQRKTGPVSSTDSASIPSTAAQKQGVAGIQSMLAECGFDPGPVDGLWGAKTTRAAAAYVRAHGGLPVAGDRSSLIAQVYDLRDQGPCPVSGSDTEGEYNSRGYTDNYGKSVYLSKCKISVGRDNSINWVSCNQSCEEFSGGINDLCRTEEQMSKAIGNSPVLNRGHIETICKYRSEAYANHCEGSRSATVSGEAESDWFTCQAGTTCVEYKIDDPNDRKHLMGQCRNPLEGRRCDTRRGCMQKAPGRMSITYDTYVNPDKFAEICKQNQGTMHTRR